MIINDPNSAPGYTTVPEVDFIIENNYTQPGTFWCFALNDPGFQPPDANDPSNLPLCPGGLGSENGWYTSLPPQLTLPAVEGPHEYCVWMVRADGTLVSNKRTCYDVIYDATPPAVFLVKGVFGENDQTVDEWFSGQTLNVRWDASSGQSDYALQIFDTTTSSLVCELKDIPAVLTEIELEDCPDFIEPRTYRIEMTVFDQARNQTQATPFNFTVDRTPPSSFMILGVRGGTDNIADEFLGDGFPVIEFSTANNSSHYQLEILYPDNSVACTLQEFSSSFVNSFDYASVVGACGSAFSHGDQFSVIISALDLAKNRRSAGNSPYSFTVDLVPPSLTITSTPAALTNDTSASFSFEATDPLSGVERFECSVNGGAFATCTSPHVVSGLSENDLTFTVRAYDHAGNVTFDDFQWTVDLTYPILTLTSVPDAYVNDPNQSVSFSATDLHGIDRYECSLNGASFTVCTSPLNVTGIVGTNQIQVRAYDGVGHYHERSTSFLLDIETPVLSFTSTPPVITASSSAMFAFSSTDPGGSGISTIECSLNAQAFSSCTSGVNFSGLAEGAHNFKVRARDNAGNTSASIEYNWNVYQTGPAITITSSPPSVNNLTSADVSFSGSVPAGISITGYECSFDSGSWVSCSSPHTVSPIAQGVHNLRVRGLDNLGNTGNHATANWTTDLTLPVVTITAIPAFSNSTSQSISFSATDSGGGSVASMECSLDGESFSTCTSSVNLSGLSAGNHEFRVRAIDTAGNTGSPAAVSWLVDLTPPTISITSTPSNPSHNLPSFSFTFSHSDAGGSGVDTVQCRLNGGVLTSCTSPHNRSFGSGSQTLEVVVTDKAGNSTSDSYTWTSHVYTWNSTGWGTCSASQPTWNSGGWSGCSASQPAYTYSGWGSCSATCGGGTRTRSQSCPIANGSQTRSVTCPVTSGSQARTVTCRRDDGTTVSDSFCDSGTRPPEVQSCTRNDCVGAAPSSTQACSRGGGSDCHSPQATSQSCNTQSCYTYSWDTGSWGSCSASASWVSGSWSTCTNTSCSGGTQTRSVTCNAPSGTQTRTVRCLRSDGATVSDSYCGGGKPSSSRSCTTSCSAGTKPATSQSCTAGTPCRYVLQSTSLLPAPLHCEPSGYKTTDGHGKTCSSTTSYQSYFWAGGQGGCSPGEGQVWQHIHKCTFCASGSWKTSGSTIACD